MFWGKRGVLRECASREFKNLKARIYKSIITWSEMGKQTAQAKEVYCEENGQEIRIEKIFTLQISVVY